MAKEMSELKKRALLAKQRLRMGYWQKMQSDRLRMEAENVDGDKIAKLQRLKLDRDVMRVTDEARAREEEKLYARVCEILERDEDTLSPIGQLIDKEAYQRMDEAGKQKYVLELSEKFRELSRRYYLEREGNAGRKMS